MSTQMFRDSSSRASSGRRCSTLSADSRGILSAPCISRFSRRQDPKDLGLLKTGGCRRVATCSCSLGEITVRSRPISRCDFTEAVCLTPSVLHFSTTLFWVLRRRYEGSAFRSPWGRIPRGNFRRFARETNDLGVEKKAYIREIR